jgi:hypothetical protein
MGKIEHIEQQVAALSEDELAVFRRWYAKFDSDAWDREIARDAIDGKLDALVAEARNDYDAGKAREL